LQERAAKIGPFYLQYLKKNLPEREDYLKLRNAWGILSLDKKYPAERIEEACQMALEQEIRGYQALKAILSAQKEAEEKAEGQSTEGPEEQPLGQVLRFERPISVYSEQVNLHITKKGATNAHSNDKEPVKSFTTTNSSKGD
jgi:hypothetical protein